jgi:DNA polymerase-1
MTIALIDADILAYQAAVGAQKTIDWGDGIWTTHAEESEAERAFDALVEKIAEAVEATEVKLAVTEGANWRNDILPTYKQNRDPSKKPLLLKHLRDRAVAQGAFLRTPLEGDDCLGILQTMKVNVGKTIICSLDKDFKTIPGRHYNFKTKEFYEITEHNADYWHMYQTLMGDATDGYSGCPGVGPKGAEKILKAALEEGTPWANRGQLQAIYWQHVLAAFKKAGLGEEEALVQARVARICQACDYDFQTKQVKLWEPTL